jgi:hypothetical protein
MKAPRDGGYKTGDKELWHADAEARTITLDKRLFTETGSHSFVFRAPGFADKSVSVTIKRPAPAINTRYGSALGAPVVFSFGSPEYQDGLTVYVTQPGGANPLMLPTSYLDRTAPGRLILRAAYFKSASCAIKEPGEYVFSFVNSRFEPGSVDFAMKFIAADIPDFDDVAAGDWYYDAVRFVIAEGLFDADESFGSDSPMTRAMLAEALYRLHGSPDVSGESPFTDSGEKSVIWAHGEGIVEGAGGGLFLPDNIITREQIAVMLYRYHKITPAEPFDVADGELSRFIDSGAVSAWAREGAAWAAQAGILRGTDNAELLPQETATRAQAAQLLFNYLFI